jgi:replicative DNA helicase
MIAKHRNGSIENVRLKLLDTSGSLIIWRDFSGGYDDLPSSMNQEDNPFITKNLPSANDAFGSNLNFDDDSDVPLIVYCNCIICLNEYFVGIFY